MKKLILAVVLIPVALLLILLISAYFNRNESVPTHLPWQIEITAAGDTRVFSMEVGSSPLRTAMESFKKVPDVALFKTPEGKFRLEAYFGKVILAFFEARVIASLEASNAELETMASASKEQNPMPSGSYEYKLTSQVVAAAANRTIQRLSYSPVADIDSQTIEKFFGQPEEKLKIGNSSEYWLYSKKGLAILLEQENKEVFYYVAPRDFPKLKNELSEFSKTFESN